VVSHEEASKRFGLVGANLTRVIPSRGGEESSNSEATLSEDQLKTQTELIKKHPLFPVMEHLLKKCERAMLTLDEDTFRMDDITDVSF